MYIYIDIDIDILFLGIKEALKELKIEIMFYGFL